jgi:hypothetical protein
MRDTWHGKPPPAVPRHWAARIVVRRTLSLENFMPKKDQNTTIIPNIGITVVEAIGWVRSARTEFSLGRDV